RQALEANKRLELLPESIFNIAMGALIEHSPEASNSQSWDFANASKIMSGLFHVKVDFSELQADDATIEALAQVTEEHVMKAYQYKLLRVPDETKIKLERWVYLQVIDKAWKNHLLGMDALKDSVSLRGYGLRDPLQEYKKEAFRMFSEMMTRIQEETTLALVGLELPEEPAQVIEQRPAREPDESKMSFAHPAQQGFGGGASPASAGSPARPAAGSPRGDGL